MASLTATCTYSINNAYGYMMRLVNGYPIDFVRIAGKSPSGDRDAPNCDY